MGERRRWRAHWLVGMTLAVISGCGGDEVSTTSGGNTSAETTGTGGSGGTGGAVSSTGTTMATGTGGTGGTMSSTGTTMATGTGGNGGAGGSTGSGGMGGSTGTMTGSGGMGGSTGTMTGSGGMGGSTGTMTGSGGMGGSTMTTGTSTGAMATSSSSGGPTGCMSEMDCDDGFSCTIDACVQGVCTHAPSSGLCDDGMYCNGVEVCNPALGAPGTGCTASSGSPCDDGLACTVDTCDEMFDGCKHTADNAACDDGAACNGAETCDLTFGCKAGTPLNCDDGVGCTDDFCDVQSGACAHVKNDLKCSNNVYCDGIEACDPANGAPGTGCKAGAAINCNDNIGCTADSCNETTNSCDHAPNNAACDDSQYCNGAETCDPALGCQNGSPIVCNDSTSCTSDSCSNAQKKCVYTPNNAACNDGLVCNGVETCDPANGMPGTGCKNGNPVVCPGDGIACTNEVCNEPNGSCSSSADNTKCAADELCIPGIGGCTAAMPCTTAAQCDDGNACNGIETCNVVCKPGTPVTCNDNVPCTIDTCNTTTGACIFTPNNNICDDGFPCNGVETCSATMGCVNGPAVNCDDGIGCTFDICNESGGTCSHLAQDYLCDDDKFCNGAETCTATGCKAGTPPVCNDNVACTSDVCDPILDACKGVPNNSLCPCGQTCSPAQGGCGSFCQVATCQGKVYACGDCLDNDGDCKIDSADNQCLGPCDNTEDGFYGGIPGQNNSPCKSDCYFDQDTGAGNDDCYWSHKCDPLEVGPAYPPEGSQCAYNPNANIAGYSGTCATAFQTQSTVCKNYCGPLTPNGCDCFGCCALPGLSYTIWLGSENPAGTGSCNINTLNDQTKCKPCTQVQACLNTCDTCEICIGKPDLPPGCIEQTCPAGVQKCGQVGQAPCPAGYSCITGCCISNPSAH